MLTKTNKNKFSKFIRISLRLIVILFTIVVIFYIWGSLNIPRIEGELSFQNSSNYNFYQNPITRVITIKKDGDLIYKFFFKPRVFAVWVDETRPFAFLVTSDTGTLDGAQGLYIYDGKETKKVYQSRTIEFSNEMKVGAKLYTTWVDQDKFKSDFENHIKDKKEKMNRGSFNISPGGRYLFGYESGYEGGIGFVIDLSTLSNSDLNFDGSDNLFWSPDKKCAVNYNYGYGYHGLQLVYFDGIDLKVKDYDENFMPDDFTGVYWADNCTGIIVVKSDYSTSFYKIGKDIGIPLKINTPNLTKLQKGEEFEWPLVNIFFTIKDPSKK